MKRIILFLFVLLGMLSNSGELYASHGMGGEITWTCLGSGQFKFRLKFYRDCNGITPGNVLSMATTVPGVPSISMSLTQQNDISPNGTTSNGVGSCPNCPQGNSGNPIAGLVEEYIYESAPVTLNGIPPAAGWTFSWGECCRSNALTNITGGGGIGFANRAVMYPFNGQNTNICYDSSPFFAEKPSTIICTGYPFKYNPNAVDPELDSLVYSWGQPIDEFLTPIPFAPGYNVNSQLPSATQNPANVAATIHPNTGEISYTSFTGGYFATVVKVTAYKCQQKVAEIFREINVVLNNNCPPISGGAQNLPPTVTAPFFDPVTGLQTAYTDTVYAGDTVNFFLSATDFDFFTNGTGQTITIEASGSEFGTNFTNPNTGCVIPPCATLSQATPFSFALFGGVGFNWVTTCDHVAGLNLNCTKISNVYNFVIKATDNYCPANASNVSTISILILPPPKLKAPVLRCASVNTNGSVTLSWTKSTPRDSQNTFHSYEIYAALNAGGPFQVVDSVKTPFLNPATYSYTHSAASLTAMFGVTAQQQSIYYYIRTRSGCSGDSISVPSDTLRTIYLNATVGGQNQTILTWNALRVPLLSSHATKYKIYKNFPIGTWTLLDSTSLLTYTDTTTKQLCADSVAYRIELPDSSGCISVSSLDGVQISNANPIATILPANPAFCTGGSVTLTANAGNSYLWNTGAVTQSITVSAGATYTVTVTQNGGCTSTGSTTVTVNPLPAPSITGTNVICSGGSTTFNAGAGYSSYLWNTGAVTQTISVSTAGTYTVTVTNANGCSKNTTRTLTVNALPVPNITGTAAICQGNTTTLNAGGGYTTYLWSNGANTQTITTGNANTYTVTVTNANGCTGTDNFVVTVNALPNPVIAGDNSICQGTTTTFDAGAGYSTYQWSNGANTQTITTGNANTYTVTVTNANGCTKSTNVVLTVNPLPTPAITGTNIICQGQNSTFNAGAGYSAYLWNTGAVTQNISVSTAGVYTVTVTDANGCTKNTTRNLTVNPNPSPSITGTTTFCQGNNSNLNAGGGYTSYLWSTGAVTQVLNVIASGTYSVTVTAANGCTATTSTPVTVNALPTPNITGTPSFCFGTNTTLNAGAGYSSYLWSNGAVTQNITVAAANTFTVTVTDANGCSNSDSQVVTVNALPNPSITGTNVICQGQNSTFDAGAGYSSYLWNTGAVTQTLSVNTSGTYTVTVTDANGCTKNTTRALTVNPNPTPSITGNNVVCQGFTTVFNAGAGYTGYLWSTGANTQTVTIGNNGPYTVTVTAANGCTASTSANLTVNALPNPVISGSTAFCQGLNTTLNAGAGYSNYLWSNGAITQSITLNTATTVTVTVTDANGCVNNTSATTTINPNPTPSITGTLTTCQGSNTTLSAGPGYSQYLWSSGATTQNINVGVAGPVTVTVTDANGCVGTDNTSVTVFALPTATLTGVDTICAGQSANINVAFGGPGPFTYTYTNGTTSQGPFTTAAGGVNISVSPGSTTTYTLVSVSNNNCAGTIGGQATINVTPLPTAVLSGTTAICSGGNTNLSIDFTGVAPYTYSYTNGINTFGPFTTSNDPVLVNVAPGGTTTYSLTPTVTGAGCLGNTNAASATVTVNTLPTAAITGTNTICNGTSTNLNINFNGTAPYTYSYSNGVTTFGPFTTSNNPATVPVSPSVSTTYNLITINDSNCTGSVQGAASITVNALPTAVVSGTTSICDGTNTNLSMQFTGTGPYTYSYSDGTTVFGPFTTNNNPALINVAPTSTTTYSVATVSDANCAGSGSGTAAITVIPLPTATISGTTAICRGSSTNLLINFTGVAPFEYKYSDGSTIYGPFTTSNMSANVSVSPNNNTNYTVTTITGSGCAGTTAGLASITVNDIPQAAIALTGDPVICNGESSEFQITFNGTAPYTYTYSNGTTTLGPFTTSNNPEIIPVTPTSTTTYSMLYLSDDNCVGTISGNAQVVVNQLPTATTSGNPSICDGSSTSFNIGFTGAAPYTYTYSDGTTTFGPFTTSSNPEVITVSPTLTTSYNAVTVSDANCVGSVSGVSNVTVYQIPTATISGTNAICFGASTNLALNFNGVAPFSYTYSNGTSNIGPLSTPNSNVTIPVSPGQSSNYTLIAINDAHCPGTYSGSAFITVNPLPEPVITGDFEICDGQTSTLSVTPSGFTNYSWSNGPVTPSVDYSTAGVYTVTVTDINGCSGTSPAVNFIVNQTPVISFSNDTSLTCEIPEINFFNNSSFPAGSEFAWDFGDNTSSNAQNPSHIFTVPGNYPITLTITTTAGCTATLQQPVDIMFFPLPEAKFIPTPIVTNVFNGKITFVDQSQNAVSWLWDFNDGAQSLEQNPSHYFNEVGEYNVRLVISNIAGCLDEYVQQVIVNPFYIPNAFTPNEDGINDYFFDAGYVLDVQSYNMSIFNRWGQRVYLGDDYTKFWNGYTESGVKAPEGVYVYSIKVVTKGGKEHTFTGTVTLLR